MSAELIFEGETLTLATQDEMRMAIMYGRFLRREKGISTFAYRGRKYLLSDRDLRDIKT
jgi:hypothetical protein